MISSLEVACTSTPVAVPVLKPVPLSRPVSAEAPDPPPSAVTLAPLPMNASVVLSNLVTATEMPTPAAPRPMPAAPATTRPDESSEAFTMTDPPASTSALAPMEARVVLLKVFTPTDPPTPTRPLAAKPMATQTILSAPWARAVMSPAAFTLPLIWASVVCLTRAICRPTPTAAVPETPAEPATPIW